MKGKGKGKESSSEEKEVPLQLPELTQMDPSKQCLIYTSILQRIKDGDMTKVRMHDLEILQHELEDLLFSVLKRLDDLDRESETLIQDKTCQEKTDKKLTGEKSQETESCGKRSSASEGNPSKKHKDGASAGRPKTKVFEDYDSDDLPPADEVRALRVDTPNRFWASLEPYFADITPDHIKFLEDWIKSHDEDDDYFQIPPIGNHYSFEWGNKNIQGEQKEGVKALDKKKGLTNHSSFNHTDPDSILVKAEKDESEDTVTLGPLAQRLVSCLIEEKMMPSLQDTIDTNKEANECPESPHPKTNFLTSFEIGDTVALEKRIRKELEEAGILKEDDDVEVKAPDDPVLVELKEVQESLKVVTEYNLAQKKRLLALAKEEMNRQEIARKLRHVDSEIVDTYRRKQKKKVLSAKEKEQILKKLKERENLINELESMGNVYL